MQLGSRAFDLLVALVEANGELVSKRDLTEKVWPNGFIDESALRVHIGTLRKALGEGKDGQRFILNEAGRGYRFVAALNKVRQPASESSTGSKNRTLVLSRPLGRIVGRDDVVAVLCDQVPDRRFLTIVGPGGMGKTTVAVAIADRLASHYEYDPLFVDFASVADASFVSSTLAALLGVVVAEEDGLPTILHALSERRQLLLFDNCEHLLEAVSALAEAILRHAPGIDILATSREPLRAEGEWIHRLLPLSLPERDDITSAADALQFSAVQLFMERAQALTGGSMLTDQDAPFAVEIARRLDGIPLALELAAARVDMFGLQMLARKLDDRFSILTKGRRTALPRHQTLRATVDWSYELLAKEEQALLRALSVFRGRFQLDDAVAVYPAGEAGIFDGLSNLVSKSMVAVEGGKRGVSYRLLDTMAAYAEEKLASSGDSQAVSLRHAQFSLDVAERANAAILEGRFASERDEFARYLDDLRWAMNWALSPKGDLALGAAITAAAGALWFQLTLLTEYRQMTERALAVIAGTDKEDTPVGLQLLTAFGQAVWHTEGPRTAMVDAFERTLELAERAGNIIYQERAHWGLWNVNTLRGDYRLGFAHAEKLEALWPKGEHAVVVDRLKSRSLNYIGRQNEAIERAHRVLGHFLANGVAPAHSLAFIEPVVARTIIARAEWLRGNPDRALSEAELAIQEMRAADHALSLCYALAVSGVPVALWAGDEQLGQSRIRELQTTSEQHGLLFWRSWSNTYDTMLNWHAAPAIDRLPEFGAMKLEHLCTWGILEALPFLEQRIDAGEGGWCIPELLRLQATALHAEGQHAEARGRLERAKGEAELSGAKSWLLRIAMTNASFLREAGQVDEAHAQLHAVYNAFTEGFGTADLERAARMLVDMERRG
ncbi:winged helix-turn-helix domain-containing protein [Neorhizobium sp. P12A]|uniref:ATP-binding protein n=1 Tax=Neorhizobium sp. P12A TaxID=2268027 RepID=UPI00165E84A9|nr:winged helix-turn-helix domain-containing protein [Neorhizobium sp. P12A]